MTIFVNLRGGCEMWRLWLAWKLREWPWNIPDGARAGKVTQDDIEWARKAALIARLKEIDKIYTTKHDPEQAHVEADAALLAYIQDGDVSDAFHNIFKWYS